MARTALQRAMAQAGRLGGRARAKNLSKQQRIDAARKAATVRWTVARVQKALKP